MPTWFERVFLSWCGRGYKYHHLQQKVQFMLVRQEFIFDETTYTKSYEEPEGIELDKDFSFALYLKNIMGQRLAHIVELPITQWICLEIVVGAIILTTIAAQGHWQYLIWVWIAVSWLSLLACILLRQKLVDVFHMLANDKDGEPLLSE